MFENSGISAEQLALQIAKGRINPDMILTSMAIAYYQNLTDRPASFLAPNINVGLSTGKYYIFNKEDLLRDNFQRKPAYGRANAAIFSRSTDIYECEVDQMIITEDVISQTNDSRLGIPSTARTAEAKALLIAQQYAIHMDRMFSERFFNSGVWDDEWTGKGSTPSASANEFLKFSDDSSDPIGFFLDRITDVKKKTGRKPNKLGLGVETYNTLIKHPQIMSRISGNCSSDNPALANEKVLATLFGVEKVGVFDSIENKAAAGADADMDFICDSKGALLAYTPAAPSLKEPSAAYTYSWDMFGDGKFMYIASGQGEFGTHVDLDECLIAPDMRKTADDLAIYMTECV